MEKNKSGKDSTGVCEKIFNAVAGFHRKSGRSQITVVTNVADSNQLTLQNADKPAITLVSVPPKETFVQQKSGSPLVDVQIHSGTPRNEGGVFRPSKTENSAAKSATVFVHIEGHDQGKFASGHDQLNKVALSNGSKPPVHSSLGKKSDQERAVSPNIVVVQGRGGQGIYVTPEKAVQNIPKPVPVKTTSKKMEHPESKKAEQGDIYSNYISEVKNRMRTPSDISDHHENVRQATRSATRRDSFNDRVAKYINRARNNFRTTSNVGDT
ncbi:OLC1v1007404C1 [Oldenlandia corymbosa var. corymbosa]|uniref:OLC1v1007404C1 n=1 Tax=Oldenlandia corymbosa var. corymbosa TaxID=529605 RepID=A0AAV1DJ78_OLDCO|nr:OLC1v1007404C1 [Oldenlandia corymbosa var. corymbosa]